MQKLLAFCAWKRLLQCYSEAVKGSEDLFFVFLLKMLTQVPRNLRLVLGNGIPTDAGTIKKNKQAKECLRIS